MSAPKPHFEQMKVFVCVHKEKVVATTLSGFQWFSTEILGDISRNISGSDHLGLSCVNIWTSLGQVQSAEVSSLASNALQQVETAHQSSRVSQV